MSTSNQQHAHRMRGAAFGELRRQRHISRGGPFRAVHEGDGEARLLHAGFLVPQRRVEDAAMPVVHGHQDRLVFARATDRRIVIRGGDRMRARQEAHAVIQLVERLEAAVHPAQDWVGGVRELHSELVARRMKARRRIARPGSTHHLAPRRPGRLGASGLHVAGCQDIEAAERIARSMHYDQPFARSHEVCHRALGHRSPARTLVIDHDQVVVG